MNTIPTPSDTSPVGPSLPSTPNPATTAEDPAAFRATASVARRPFWDRIGEAVRAAHRASVPF